jgi:hypothetical protein
MRALGLPQDGRGGERVPRGVDELVLKQVWGWGASWSNRRAELSVPDPAGPHRSKVRRRRLGLDGAWKTRP